MPAVIDAWCPHPRQCSKPRRVSHAESDVQREQRKPVGQRTLTRYSRHPASVANQRSNSPRFLGYSASGKPEHYPVRSLETRGYVLADNLQEITDRRHHYLVAGRQAERTPHLDAFEDDADWTEVIRQPSPRNPGQKKSRVEIKRHLVDREVHILCRSETAFWNVRRELLSENVLALIYSLHGDRRAMLVSDPASRTRQTGG